MEYIKNYENMTEFNAAEPSGAGEFVMSIEPGVAYVKDAEKVCYNMPELLIDVRYIDSGRWEDVGITTELYNYYLSIMGENETVTDLETLNKFKLYLDDSYKSEGYGLSSVTKVTERNVYDRETHTWITEDVSGLRFERDGRQCETSITFYIYEDRIIINSPTLC